MYTISSTSRQQSDRILSCAGDCSRSNSGDDVYLAKIDKHGGFSTPTPTPTLEPPETPTATPTPDQTPTPTPSPHHALALTKTDRSGQIEWSKTYDKGGDPECYWLERSLDGGYVMTGSLFIENDNQHPADV
ncbi:hypothetical protein JXQ70_11715 [bacterium]|nr:hypothetical protein [bacterium]